MEVWAAIIGAAIASAITATALIISSRLQSRGEKEEREKDREERQIEKQAEVKRQLNRERINPVIEIMIEIGGLMLKLVNFSDRPLKDLVREGSDYETVIKEIQFIANNRIWTAIVPAIGIDTQIQIETSEILNLLREYLTYHMDTIITIRIERKKLQLELAKLEGQSKQQKEVELVEMDNKSLYDHITDKSHLKELQHKIGNGTVKVLNICYGLLETS